MQIDCPLTAVATCRWHFDHGEDLSPHELAALFAALAEFAGHVRGLPFTLTVTFCPAVVPPPLGPVYTED